MSKITRVVAADGVGGDVFAFVVEEAVGVSVPGVALDGQSANQDN